MINNKIKYLSVFSTLLLAGNSISFAMDTNEIIINNENQKQNLFKGKNNNLQIQNKKDKNIDNKSYDAKYHSTKKYIMDGYSKIQEHLTTFCNITKTFENSLQDFMKYSDNNNLEGLLDTIQKVYYNFLSFDDNATSDEKKDAKKYVKSLHIPDTILSYVILRNSNNNIDNFNNTISNNNDIVKKVNALLKIIESQDINNIKEFIKEQEEKLMIIKTYNDSDNDVDTKLNEKYTNAMSNFTRMFYNYNGDNDKSQNSNYFYSNLNTSFHYVDLESNLNIGEIDKKYTTETHYREKYKKKLEYGKMLLDNLKKMKIHGETSNKDMMNILLEIAQEYDDQVYVYALQVIFGIKSCDKLLDLLDIRSENDLLKFLGVKSKFELEDSFSIKSKDELLDMLLKKFHQGIITHLIDTLDENTIQESIEKLNDRLIETLGDTYIQNETRKKISNNAEQIIDSYKILIANGNNFIEELNKLQNELDSFLQNIKNKNFQ